MLSPVDGPIVVDVATIEEEILELPRLKSLVERIGGMVGLR